MIFSARSYLALAVGTVVLCGPGQTRAELPGVETVTVPTTAWERNMKVQRETHRLVEARDMDGLEKLADGLRANRERLDGGTWILSSYYDAVGHLPKDEAETKETMAFFERWAKERPESMTAQISYAEALSSHAWRARGTGWASEVTVDGWSDFRKRLEQARKVLFAVESRRKDFPDWTEAMQTVALGQNWSRQSYMEMVNAAVEREPTYGRYYTSTCYYLLPRWHGSAGDFEHWLKEKADAYPPEERDRQYAFLVWMAERMPVRGELVFENGRLDWGRTKRGFEQWLASGENLMVRFEFIRLGLIANDRETVREQFDTIGAKYWAPMWKNEEQFQAALAYAYENGPNPMAEKSAHQERKNPQLDTHAIAILGEITRYGAGMAGGLLAGGLLLTIGLQRREGMAGAAALAASVVLGTVAGTMTTLIAAAGLWAYLRSKRNVWPPELAAPHGGMVFLWVAVICGGFLGLQVAAAILVFIPEVAMDLANPDTERITEEMMANGTTSRIAISSGWIALLGLVAVCGRLDRAGWERRLGLKPVKIVPAVLWTVVGAVLTIGTGMVTMIFMDERSRESLQVIASGLQSPVSYYIALVVMAPIFEELLFRGYAYSGWIERIGFWPTAVASSLIFTVAHVQYGWMGLVFVFTLGMILAGVRRITGSVYPCIAVHFLNNLASTLMTTFSPDRF